MRRLGCRALGVGAAGLILCAASPGHAEEAAAWAPKHPKGVGFDPTTTNSQFWPALLERLCTDEAGKLRADRAEICASEPDPSKPADAASILSTFVDDRHLAAVRVKDQPAKIISLQNQTTATLLSQIQPANGATPGTQGTPAQTDAVPSIQPVSQTAAAAALAATRAGERVFASLAVNPVGMFTTSTNDPAVQEPGTHATRLTDVSLVVPVNPAGSTAGNGGLGSFDYVGVRLRINATPLFKDALYPVALKAVRKAFNDALAAEASRSKTADELLASFDGSGCASSLLPRKPRHPACDRPIASSQDFEAQVEGAAGCAEALAAGVASQITTACRRPIDDDPSRSAEAKLHGALATLRDQYDASYIGLDARYDYGDPTFSGLAIARGSHLLAALAAGHRLLTGGDVGSRHGFFGLKGRLGYQMTSLNDNADRASSLDFAGGIEAGVINDLQVFKFSIGAEGRHTWRTPPTAADTNFVDIKIAVDIPQSDGTRLGALLSLPANGDHGATLSLVGNWSALTGALAPPK